MSTPTSDSLREAKCLPCEGGVAPLEGDALDEHLHALSLWAVNESGHAIYRKFDCRNFVRAVALVNEIADVAEAEQHHPDLHLTGYRHLTVELTTHAIGGLSENDFILAAKIDRLAE